MGPSYTRTVIPQTASSSREGKRSIDGHHLSVLSDGFKYIIIRMNYPDAGLSSFEDAESGRSPFASRKVNPYNLPTTAIQFYTFVPCLPALEPAWSGARRSLLTSVFLT